MIDYGVSYIEFDTDGDEKLQKELQRKTYRKVYTVEDEEYLVEAITEDTGLAVYRIVYERI